MKLVIEIPDEIYKKYIDDRTHVTDVLHAVRHGKPLPEHHGRLIDADEFQRYCFNKNFDRRLSEGGLATINMFLELQPTIIEGSDSK